MRTTNKIGIAVIFLFFISVFQLFSQSVVLKVGVYENYPLVYTDDSGMVRGFTVKILEYIAEREGWGLEYQNRSWTDSLAALEKGELDLQVGIAKTEEREALYDFTNETVFTAWGQVYSRSGILIESVLDVEGRRVALYKGSYLTTQFRQLVGSFDIECVFIEYNDYSEMINAMDSGMADIGVFNRTFGEDTPVFSKLVRTPIVFSPIGVRYAVPEGNTPWLIEVMDRYIHDLKRDKGSRYYSLLNEMLGTMTEETIPVWIIAIIAGIGALLLISFIIIAVFRSRIESATREIRNKNTHLQKSLHEKDLLLKEVHHRVKNNLNTISSLLHLQTYYTDNDELAVQYREIISRVKTIGIIHERLYQTEDFSNIDFCEYIDKLINELEDVFAIDRSRIKIYHDCVSRSFDIETAIPIGLIINELITNAVKYAFPEDRKGEIHIKFLSTEGKVQLIVNDNGVGMPESTGLEKKHGLGLQLVKALIKQINGSIEQEKGEGVTYIISFGESK